MEICDVKENYSSGWIKIYRSIKYHWVWRDPIYFRMWVDFLMRANHKENKIVIDGEFVEILRGAFISSLKKLAKDYKCSIHKVRHFLELLEKDSMILLKTTHKYTQITIVNYSIYQDESQTEGNQKENRRKSEGNQKETNKNDKNVKNDKKIMEITHDLQKWVIENCKNVSKLESQLTAEESEKLLSEFGWGIVSETLIAMDNYKPLLNKYKSVNLTLRNWIKIRMEKNNGVTKGNIRPKNFVSPERVKADMREAF